MRNGSTLLGVTSYRTPGIGAMGYTTGIVTASDESWQAVKTDGAGGWRRDGASGVWSQIFRRDNTSAAMFDIDPTYGENDGTWELEIALSDPTVAYASWRHRIMKSTDSGASWSLCTAVPEMLMSANAQGGSPGSYQRLAFGKLAIDPSNKDVVYWAPEGQGLLRTLDGMSSYASIASVPAAISPYSRAANNDRYMMIAVDDTSSLTSGRHSVVYVASIGNGIYKSTDGGDTFTQISATVLYPSNIQCIGGVLWVFNYLTTGNTLAGATNIYTYNGSWSTAFGSASQAIRFIQPDLTNSAVLFSGKFLYRSDDGGSTWSDPVGGSGTNVSAVAGDAPLMAVEFNATKTLINSRLSAHSNGNVYISTGYGIMYATAANWKAAVNPGTGLVLYEDTAGIENIVPQAALFTPLGDGFMMCQDKAIIKLTDPGTFPTKCYPLTELTNGFDIDYAAQDPTYLAAVYGKGSGKCCYTTDRGETWQDFPTFGTTKIGGGIAVVDVGHVVIFPGANGWPVVTNDGGETWSDCAFSGFAKITSGETGWGFGTIETDRFIVCNDKDNPTTLWAYNYGVSGNAASKGIWKSTDGGFNWSNVNNTSVINALLAGYSNALRHRDGILWLCPNSTTPYNSENAGAPMFRSTDGGVTWGQVPGLNEPYYYCFGKKAATSSGSYPALWAIGWVGGVKGVYRCDNADAATVGDMTWTKVASSPAFARPTAMGGDPTKYGHLLIGRGGMSFEEAFYDYTMTLT